MIKLNYFFTFNKFLIKFRQVYYSHLFPKAKVYGIEHIKALAKWSLGNIAKYKNKVNFKNITIIAGDGRQGLPKEGPFDFIHCGAGKLILFYFISIISF